MTELKALQKELIKLTRNNTIKWNPTIYNTTEKIYHTEIPKIYQAYETQINDQKITLPYYTLCGRIYNFLITNESPLIYIGVNPKLIRQIQNQIQKQKEGQVEIVAKQIRQAIAQKIE